MTRASICFSVAVWLSALLACRRKTDAGEHLSRGAASASAIRPQPAPSSSVGTTPPENAQREAAAASASVAPEASGPDVDAIRAIGRSIAALKPAYPQLAEFDPERNVSADQLWITYKYRTTRSTARGGWTAQVPSPLADGIWFYIDFHDPNSRRQIHTQPFTGRFVFRDKNVSFLMLEGAKTKSLHAALWKILRQHGVQSLPL